MRTHIIRQAIVTEYVGQTEKHGPQIRATAYAGFIVEDWQGQLGFEENHIRAANALAKKFGWLNKHDLHGGALPKGGYVFLPVGKPCTSSSHLDKGPCQHCGSSENVHCVEIKRK